MNAEREDESECDLNWSLAPAEANDTIAPWQIVLLMSNQRRSNSRSRSSFYPGGRVPHVVFFFNVNSFNFFQQPFSSNSNVNSMIHILLNYLQIQGSGTGPSPFELRPVAFMVSVGCLVVYYLASSAKFVFPGFASQFGVLVSVFGSLAVATLISLTLQLPWWSIFFLLLFMGGIFKLLTILHATYGNIRRHPRPTTMQPILPL